MLLLVNIYGIALLKALGLAAMLFNILYFAAPLAGLVRFAYLNYDF
jgi:hypothetical protein